MLSDHSCCGIRSSLRFTSVTQYFSSLAAQPSPVAAIVALIAPIEVPETHAISDKISFLSRYLSAPTWKSPSVPPPPNTMPIGIRSPPNLRFLHRDGNPALRRGSILTMCVEIRPYYPASVADSGDSP